AYVNGVFSISPPVVRPTDPDTPVAIYHLYQAKMWGEESGACAVELNIDQQMPMIPRYESLLVSGFGQQPPPSLQEMLNQGYKVEIGDYEVITGARVISPDVQPDLARFPFTRCIVSWRFAHQKYEAP
ncbi:MAG: hypothetical protein LLG97_14015, partial [Deltaproteobacteria bacterium]|nr:hypothetical protein [Deltaproteobacteria bacterium]